MHSVRQIDEHPLDAEWKALERAWRDASATQAQVSSGEARFAALCSSPGGAEFLEALADEIVRFDNPVGAARGAARLSAALETGQLEAPVGWGDRIPLALAAGVAPLLPRPAAWLGQRAARRHLGHLFVTAERLGRRLGELDAVGGYRPVIAPVHSRALGDRHADLQLAELEALLSDPAMPSAALSLAAITRLGSGGTGSAARERLIGTAAARLGRLAALAREAGSELVVDVERHRDVTLTVATVLHVLDEPENDGLRVTLTLPMNSNDSFALLPQLSAWARDRHTSGATPLTLRFSHSDELREERAAAERRRWPMRAHTDPGVTFANLRRMLEWILDTDRIRGLRIVVASERAHDHAFAWRLARHRGLLRSVDHEVRMGAATGLAEVMKRVVGGVSLRVPLVNERGTPRAADYLLRRVRQRRDDETVTDVTAIPDLDALAMGPRRVTDADPCSPEGRDWFDTVAQRAARPLRPAPVTAVVGDADQHLHRAAVAAESWAERRGSTRATVLREVAESLAHARADLAVSAMLESGLTAAEADAEVTDAIAAALSAAAAAESHPATGSAAFRAVPLVLVLASRSSPIANPLAQAAGALAAGSGVVIKPAPENPHTAATLVAAVRDGGVPDDLIVLLEAGETGAVGDALGDDRVGRVVHSGSRHIAKKLRSEHPDASLLSTTGGRNAVIISESAAIERAVADVVASAFTNAGQAAESVGTVIVVGEHERFVSLLTDAVASIHPGESRDPATELATLCRPATGAMLQCLTTLGDGESWLVEPRQLDHEGRRWSPGLVDGVAPGSIRHVMERRAPLLSIVRAESFDHAVDIQNGPGFGLVAGLQSGDPDEIAQWLDAAEAGGLAVNAPTTGPGWSRLPVVGWRRSNVGVARAPGGRLFLDQFGDWLPRQPEPEESVTLEGMSDRVAALITAAQPALSFDEFDWVRSAARDDEAQWRGEFGRELEVVNEPGELVVTRYRPVPTIVRLGEGGTIALLVRVLAAATRVHAPVAVSCASPLPEPLIRFFGLSDSPVAEVVVEAESRWLARAHAGELVTERVRVIGDDRGALRRVLSRHAGTAPITGPVTASGRVELANFVAEQTVIVRSA